MIRRLAGRLPALSRGSWATPLLSRRGATTLRRAENLLFHGWSQEGLALLAGVERNGGRAARLSALNLKNRWSAWRRTWTARTLKADVAIVSHLALPGGNASAVAEEVRALKAAGKTVVLVHHPVRTWNITRALNPKIADLLDGESAVLAGPGDAVECGLAVLRLPTVFMRPMEDLPEITARRTVLVVNQTPFKYYEGDRGVDKAWDVATVRENVQRLFGDHTWLPVGPVVREALSDHHSTAMSEMDLSGDYWYEVLDLARWRAKAIDGEAAPTSRPIVIGRHSRDHELKWPHGRDLADAYPAGRTTEVRVLGGSNVPRKRLGGLPETWTDLPFGSTDVQEFLHSLDVYVYFIDPAAQEAFGYAPMEAMAAGVPVVCDRRLEPLFGEAAVYCEPSEVEGTVRALAQSPARWRAQAQRARDAVRQRFSHEALIRRVDDLVAAGKPRRRGDYATR
ncbi:glycosyltransferase [Salininema proteolyticum]|uniref:Glycosyltransferase n=1 Tax=Salininema proteolyticum TaxID=1607685 RepID=A0ABV8TXX7_9ACTN